MVQPLMACILRQTIATYGLYYGSRVFGSGDLGVVLVTISWQKLHSHPWNLSNPMQVSKYVEHAPALVMTHDWHVKS